MLLIFPERRIEFNYEEFGDSPTCLSEKDDIGGLSSLVLRLNMIVLRISKALNSLRKMILIR